MSALVNDVTLTSIIMNNALLFIVVILGVFEVGHIEAVNLEFSLSQSFLSFFPLSVSSACVWVPPLSFLIRCNDPGLLLDVCVCVCGYVCVCSLPVCFGPLHHVWTGVS